MPAAVVRSVQPTVEAAPSGFVGREDEVRQILSVLDPTGEGSGRVTVSALSGLGGIGKTATALHAASVAAGRDWFPGGAVWLDLAGYAEQAEQAGDALQPADCYVPILHALGEMEPQLAHEPPSVQAAR